MNQRKMAIAGVSAAMLIGAGTGLLLGVPGGAGASSGATAVTDPTDDTGTSTESTDGTVAGRPAGGVESSLAELVAAGTITQEQADAILAAIEANRPAGGPGGFRGGPGGPGHGHGPGAGKHLETAATALGITTDELKAELEAGKTIADVASEQGIDVQTVIDAIVAAETADIVERVTDRVNGVMPVRPDTSTDDSSTTDDPSTTEDSGGS